MHGSRAREVQLTMDAAPARCADLLARGSVEAALVPVIEYQRLPEVVLVSDACVGARTEVRSVVLVADSTKLRRSAPVRIAHLSQIQTFVTDAPLPASLASICSHRGIEVVEAMDKPAADIDDNGADPAPVPLRSV